MADLPNGFNYPSTEIASGLRPFYGNRKVAITHTNNQIRFFEPR